MKQANILPTCYSFTSNCSPMCCRSTPDTDADVMRILSEPQDNVDFDSSARTFGEILLGSAGSSAGQIRLIIDPVQRPYSWSPEKAQQTGEALLEIYRSVQSASTVICPCYISWRDVCCSQCAGALWLRKTLVVLCSHHMQRMTHQIWTRLGACRAQCCMPSVQVTDSKVQFWRSYAAQGFQ